MRRFLTIWLIVGSFGANALNPVRDTLHFRGQISAWANVSLANDLPARVGGRIIPQANYKIFLPSRHLLDFEVSANIRGSSGFSFFDSLRTDGNIKAYRAWARFSGKQFELRAGLQKINFGSATMLRPLMWFDQMDPRDPLQLTDGVWGILGRYYFLNNANIWLWSLLGNKGQRAWDFLETPPRRPEFGGRIQMPVLPGEAALSYHFRQTRLPHDLIIVAASPDNRSPGLNSIGQTFVMGNLMKYLSEFTQDRSLSERFPAGSEQAVVQSEALLLPGMTGIHPEHRFALDGKWDIGPGIWFESVWVHHAGNFGNLSNQTMLNLGADYTFGIGNGLNLAFEHLIFSYDEKAFAFGNSDSFSALSASYPLGMNHHLSTILYYDEANQNLYSFLNWRVQLRKFMCYTMAWWNPKQLSLPQMASGEQLFSGKGVQVMLVYSL